MPRLVRLYIQQCLYGFALSVVFVGLLLALDVAGLRGLVGSTPGGWIAIVMLWFANGQVFAGVQFAITIMGMAEGEAQGPGPGRRLGAWLRRAEPALVPVKEDEAAGPQRP